MSCRATVIGQALESFRHDSTLSIEALATRTRIDPDVIADYECGQQVPPRHAIARIADALGCGDAARRTLFASAGYDVPDSKALADAHAALHYVRMVTLELMDTTDSEAIQLGLENIRRAVLTVLPPLEESAA